MASIFSIWASQLFFGLLQLSALGVCEGTLRRAAEVEQGLWQAFLYGLRRQAPSGS